MKTLKAENGKILYDGTRYTDLIYAPDDADLSMWRQITISSDNEEATAYREAQRSTYEGMLVATNDDFIAKLEEYFAENGEGELKSLAEQRRNARTQLDSLGKVVQSAQGTGTAFDPYKVWKEGMAVNSGDWWMTNDGYLWQAIKTGVPTSSTDNEYWDVV